MASPFAPPSPDGKPPVPEWDAPEPTDKNLDWVDLHTIDLALLDSPNPKVVAELVATTKTAIRDDGFLFLVNYGVSLEQLHRQFALAQHLHRNISDEDKEALMWDPSTGTFSGFKRRLGWKREAGDYDGIEQFNFYAAEFLDTGRVPKCILPFMDEITAFCEYLTGSVNRRLLRLLSLVLELPGDYLWDHIQSHGNTVGDGYFRHALYYPLEEDLLKARDGIRMYGHTDYGTTTMLFSVPVTALQIFTRNKRWQPVKYKPGALVINIGDSLEVLSGGHFQATLHKVADPPSDQRDKERLSLVLFNAPKGSLRLSPVMESPLIQRSGFVVRKGGVFEGYKRCMDSGLPIPSSKQWREIQISTRLQVPAEQKGGMEVIDGIKHSKDTYYGVPVLTPV